MRMFLFLHYSNIFVVEVSLTLSIFIMKIDLKKIDCKVKYAGYVLNFTAVGPQYVNHK